MRWILRGLLAFILLILLYQLWIFMHVCWWINHNPSTSAFMENRLQILQENNPDAELRYKWVEYSRISMHLKRAVIASEDAKFVDHEGFDWEGYKKPMKRI